MKDGNIRPDARGPDRNAIVCGTADHGLDDLSMPASGPPEFAIVSGTD